MQQTPGGIIVAISADFLKAFALIPAKQQAKVRDFVERFRANPAAPSINYEKLRQARDPNVRSVRIDETYRGIVVKPESGNVYVLVWVDHHDDAYRWAENRIFAVHAETGSLQVLDVESIERTLQQTSPVTEAQGLFRDLRDRELKRVGVPDALIPLVRSIATEADLDGVAEYLPQEASEALYMLAAGYSLQEVADAAAKREAAAPVDAQDFASALETPDSRRRFHVMEDAVELAQILGAPLEQWRVFLHPSQRRIVEADVNGPMRVLGGAGTGKTVVAMHRARWLAEKVFLGEHDRILFTTFTKNLAADIQSNLRTLCPPALLRKIEVINLDAWVNAFLRQQGMDVTVMFEGEAKELWQRALAQAPAEPGLPEQFYLDEWKAVIQAQGISTREEYDGASRVGRGRSLTRADRRRIWPVFEEYRAELNRRGAKELVDCMRDARSLLRAKGDILPYRAVIVDEAQDMGMEAFRLIRQMIPPSRGETPNDLFIVGDAHQRIYGRAVVLGRCGIEIRGRSRKLRINYRTTEETRRWAVGILHGRAFDDLDGGLDDQLGYRSLLHGSAPDLHAFDSFAQEVDFIASTLGELQRDTVPSSNCLVARKRDLLSQYEGALKSRGIEVRTIRPNTAEDRGGGVRLATMHRVKGLEFEYVIIAGANDEYIPLKSLLDTADGEAEREETETAERSLLYVAATRARRGLIVTCHGKASRLLGT